MALQEVHKVAPVVAAYLSAFHVPMLLGLRALALRLQRIHVQTPPSGHVQARMAESDSQSFQPYQGWQGFPLVQLRLDDSEAGRVDNLPSYQPSAFPGPSKDLVHPFLQSP